jgi:hypothetical protein
MFGDPRTKDASKQLPARTSRGSDLVTGHSAGAGSALRHSSIDLSQLGLGLRDSAALGIGVWEDLAQSLDPIFREVVT